MKAHILLVEDNQAVLGATTMLLKAQGYRVTTATSVAEAIRQKANPQTKALSVATYNFKYIQNCANNWSLSQTLTREQEDGLLIVKAFLRQWLEKQEEQIGSFLIAQFNELKKLFP